MSGINGRPRDVDFHPWVFCWATLPAGGASGGECEKLWDDLVALTGAVAW